MDRGTVSPSARYFDGGLAMNELHDIVLSVLDGHGVEDGVSILSSSQEAMFRFSRNQMTVANSLDEKSLTVFIRHDGGGSSITIADVRPQAVKKAVETMVKRLSSRHASRQRLPSGPFRYDDKLLRGKPVQIEGDELVDTVQKAVHAAQEAGALRVSGTLRTENNHVSLCSTRGVEAEAVLPTAELSLRAFCDSRSSGHGLSVSGSLSGIKAEEAGQEAGMLAAASRNPVDCDPGKYQALLSPMVAADIASQVGSMASAFYVDVGMSFLADSIGKQVCSPVITMEDDPTLYGTLGARPFDDEGSPTRKNTIIENGVLCRHLHNYVTATSADVPNTANAGLVSPHPFNLVISPGEQDKDRLLAEMDRGIYVTNIWYLRYQNYRNGDFSAIPRDAMFLVEDGAITGPVRDLRISDNVLGILSRLSGLSQERRWIKWWEVDTPTLSPFMLSDEVNFTRSTM